MITRVPFLFFGFSVPLFFGSSVPLLYGLSVPLFFGLSVPLFFGLPVPLFFGLSVPLFSGLPVPLCPITYALEWFSYRLCRTRFVRFVASPSAILPTAKQHSAGATLTLGTHSSSSLNLRVSRKTKRSLLIPTAAHRCVCVCACLTCHSVAVAHARAHVRAHVRAEVFVRGSLPSRCARDARRAGDGTADGHHRRRRIRPPPIHRPRAPDAHKRGGAARCRRRRSKVLPSERMALSAGPAAGGSARTPPIMRYIAL